MLKREKADVLGTECVVYPAQLSKSRLITSPTVPAPPLLTLSSSCVSSLPSARLSVIVWLFDFDDAASSPLTHLSPFCPVCARFLFLFDKFCKQLIGENAEQRCWVLWMCENPFFSDSSSGKIMLLTSPHPEIIQKVEWDYICAWNIGSIHAQHMTTYPLMQLWKDDRLTVEFTHILLIQ